MFLVVLLSLSLVGCGKKEEPEEDILDNDFEETETWDYDEDDTESTDFDSDSWISTGKIRPTKKTMITIGGRIVRVVRPVKTYYGLMLP